MAEKKTADVLTANIAAALNLPAQTLTSVRNRYLSLSNHHEFTPAIISLEYVD